MGTETNKEERNTPEYLAQLLKDKKQIQAFPNVFLHLERLLDEGKFQWRKMDAPEILLVDLFSRPKLTRYSFNCSKNDLLLLLRILVFLVSGYLVKIGCIKAGYEISLRDCEITFQQFDSQKLGRG